MGGRIRKLLNETHRVEELRQLIYYFLVIDEWAAFWYPATHSKNGMIQFHPH
jgi:hypothetical protein